MIRFLRDLFFKSKTGSTAINAAIDEAFKSTFEEMGYSFEKKGNVKKVNAAGQKNKAILF